MFIAVISDTHDHKDNILKAVSIMNERKVDALIHCGDYCSPFIERWFRGLNENIQQNFYGVFGNNDGERLMLEKILRPLCEIVGLELIKDFGGLIIYASHMPSPDTIEALANSSSFDIILSGHTHHVVNKKYDNGVLVVNPGEACGYLTGNATFCIIDTIKKEAEIIQLG